jgi:membrane protein YdbS with pleckstrin-like domain
MDNIRRASEWCYHGIWYPLTKWFLVPRDPPSLPSTQGEWVQSFRPSEGYLNYLRFFFWVGLVAIDLALTIAWLAIAIVSPLVGLLITPIALAVIILPDIVAYIAIHLRYDTTWYVLTDRSMRIRRGILTIHETTITFENIQNIHLHQGPVQRMFGFATLQVETAGGGGGGAKQQGAGFGHRGLMEGLSNAVEIRELIMRQIKGQRSAGLGDDHQGSEHPYVNIGGFSDRQVKLLREIRELTSALAIQKR